MEQEPAKKTRIRTGRRVEEARALLMGVEEASRSPPVASTSQQTITQTISNTDEKAAPLPVSPTCVTVLSHRKNSGACPCSRPRPSLTDPLACRLLLRYRLSDLPCADVSREYRLA